MRKQIKLSRMTYYCDIFSNDCDIRPSEVGQCSYGRYACTVQEVAIMIENVDIKTDLPDLRSQCMMGVKPRCIFRYIINKYEASRILKDSITFIERKPVL